MAIIFVVLLLLPAGGTTIPTILSPVKHSYGKKYRSTEQITEEL